VISGGIFALISKSIYFYYVIFICGKNKLPILQWFGAIVEEVAKHKKYLVSVVSISSTLVIIIIMLD